MGQEIAAQTTGNSLTAWSAPQLEPRLRNFVDQATSFALAEIVTREDYATLKAELERPGVKPDMTPTTTAHIYELMATMATIHPDAKLSDTEQTIRLKTYMKTLKDLPADVLSEAFKLCAQEVTFFPKVAEIRQRASRILYERWKPYNGMKMLVLKFEMEGPALEDTHEPPRTQEERDEFNRTMKRCGLPTRQFADGTIRRLEPGEDDPAPRLPQPPLEGDAEEPVLPL